MAVRRTMIGDRLFRTHLAPRGSRYREP